MKTDVLLDDNINFPVDECIDYAEENDVHNYDCVVCPLKENCPVFRSVEEKINDSK